MPYVLFFHIIIKYAKISNTRNSSAYVNRLFGCPHPCGRLSLTGMTAAKFAMTAENLLLAVRTSAVKVRSVAVKVRHFAARPAIIHLKPFIIQQNLKSSIVNPKMKRSIIFKETSKNSQRHPELVSGSLVSASLQIQEIAGHARNDGSVAKGVFRSPFKSNQKRIIKN